MNSSCAFHCLHLESGAKEFSVGQIFPVGLTGWIGGKCKLVFSSDEMRKNLNGEVQK